MVAPYRPPRLLIIPGLHDSGPAHWQTWLQRWAKRWGANYTKLGPVGHINTESGFGPFPLARRWVEAARERAARERRAAHAAFDEWSFAL